MIDVLWIYVYACMAPGNKPLRMLQIYHITAYLYMHYPCNEKKPNQLSPKKQQVYTKI
jgi:hypothetical protein